MTIEEAFEQLMNTSAYREIAKNKDTQGGKYRVYRQRFNKAILKAGAMVELLIEHGYKITVRK